MGFRPFRSIKKSVQGAYKGDGIKGAVVGTLKLGAGIMAAPVIGIGGVIGVNKGKDALQAAGEVPNLEMPDPSALPTPESAAPQIEEAQKKVRKPQGRAATLLAGASSAAESGLQLAKRTLMGR